MFQLRHDHVGQTIKAKIRESATRTVDIEGLVHFENGRFYILSENPMFNNGAMCHNQQGYPYVFNIGAEHTLGNHNFPRPILKVWIESSNILFQKSESGTLFRRIYKTEKEKSLIYLGPVRKDPEECKKPSALVYILDLDYLTSKGWALYKELPSAESRIKSNNKVEI